jgi:hypothetical protein
MTVQNVELYFDETKKVTQRSPEKEPEPRTPTKIIFRDSALLHLRQLQLRNKSYIDQQVSEIGEIRIMNLP